MVGCRLPGQMGSRCHPVMRWFRVCGRQRHLIPLCPPHWESLSLQNIPAGAGELHRLPRAGGEVFSGEGTYLRVHVSQAVPVSSF